MTTFTFSRVLAGAGFAAVLGFASAGNAASLGTLATPFLPGDGNTNTNFMIDGALFDDGYELGIKAKAGFAGDLPTDGTGTYFAETGSRTNGDGVLEPGLAKWNFEFSVNTQISPVSNFDVVLTLDFNPAVGNTDFLTFDIDAAILATPEVPDNTPLFQASQNYGFGFLTTGSGYTFDVDVPGEYFIGLEIFQKGETVAFGSTSALVSVAAPIPLPAGLPLLLAGLGGLAILRRRKA